MKILVFTNYDSMKNVYSPAVSITDDSGIVTPNSFGELLQNHKIVCREGTTWNGYTDLPNIMDSAFVLIRDDISFEDFALLKGKIVDSEYYIIHHRKPDTENFKELKRSVNWKEGQHDSKNPLYQPIADCIAGAVNKADKQLAEEIDNILKLSKVKLERQKTDFLYSIYGGKVITLANPPVAFLNEIKDLEAYKYFEKEGNKFDNSKEEHRNHLITLRDTLLSKN